MDDKYPDLDPPAYSETSQQLANNADIPPIYEANVELVNGMPMFSNSVKIANQELLKFKDYDRRDPRVEGFREKCPWQHCKNLHPHRHFWARDLYKYDMHRVWGKAFEGIVETCGWEKCTEAQDGHWHTLMPKGRSAYRMGYYDERYFYPARRDIVLATNLASVSEQLQDCVRRKKYFDYLKDLEGYGWIREGFTEEVRNAGTELPTWAEGLVNYD